MSAISAAQRAAIVDDDTQRARRRSKARRSGLGQLIWIGPTLLVVVIVIVYPIIETVRLSFTKISSAGTISGANGVKNFVALFADPEFIPIVLQTLLWLSAVVIGTAIVAWPLAQFLNLQFPGRRWVRYAVIVPWAAGLSTSALIFKWMFDYQYGAINRVLMLLGIIHEPIVWLGTTGWSWTTLIVLGIFVSVPFNTYILLAGLQSIPGEVYEAAKLDGAGPWRTWMHITRPMLSTSAFLAIILNIMGVFNSFVLINVLTNGGPGRTTQTTFTYMYQLGFGSGQMGESAALSVFNLLFLAVIVTIYVRMSRNTLREL